MLVQNHRSTSAIKREYSVSFPHPDWHQRIIALWKVKLRGGSLVFCIWCCMTHNGNDCSCLSWQRTWKGCTRQIEIKGRGCLHIPVPLLTCSVTSERSFTPPTANRHWRPHSSMLRYRSNKWKREMRASTVGRQKCLEGGGGVGQ